MGIVSKPHQRTDKKLTDGRTDGEIGRMDGGLSSHLKRTPSSEWKKVRDGGRNAYAGSNLSSVRDIKRFFDTGGRVGGVGECLLGGHGAYFPKCPLPDA